MPLGRSGVDRFIYVNATFLERFRELASAKEAVLFIMRYQNKEHDPHFPPDVPVANETSGNPSAQQTPPTQTNWLRCDRWRRRETTRMKTQRTNAPSPGCTRPLDLKTSITSKRLPWLAPFLAWSRIPTMYVMRPWNRPHTLGFPCQGIQRVLSPQLSAG